MVGRLPTHNREEIAYKLIQWAELETSLNLCAFCKDNRIVPEKLSVWSKECELFRQAVDFAKGCIGARREEALKDGRLHVKCYDLNSKTYDYFLRKEVRDEIEFQARVKAQADKAAQVEGKKEVLDGMQSILDQLDSKRSATISLSVESDKGV